MSILNIAGYKFVEIAALEDLREIFFNHCQILQLKGTILLSQEGININLAGLEPQIDQFKSFIQQDERFASIEWRESYSRHIPFKRLKIKIKKEIITFRHAPTNPVEHRAPPIAPQTLQTWLDEKKDFVLLDTRNTFEVAMGSFEHAQHLNIDNFCEFTSAIASLPNDKTVVMYCTGGIRCEKAALYMLSQGYQDVYQLEGGILNYFKMVGGKHYSGECFVFDERIAVDANLHPQNESEQN